MKRLILGMMFWGYVSGMHNTYGTHCLVIPTESKSIVSMSTFVGLDREHKLSTLSSMISKLSSMELLGVFNNIRGIDGKSSDELSDLWNTVVAFCKQCHVRCHAEATKDGTLLDKQGYLNKFFANYGSVRVCNYKTSEDRLKEMLGCVCYRKEQCYLDLRIPRDEVSSVLSVIEKEFQNCSLEVLIAEDQIIALDKINDSVLEWKNKMLVVLGDKEKKQATIETLQELSTIAKFLRDYVREYVKFDRFGNLSDLKARLNTIEDTDRELASYPCLVSQSE